MVPIPARLLMYSVTREYYLSPVGRRCRLGTVPPRRGVMTVLAGDVWRADNPFQESLLRARRSQAAPVSEASRG